MGSREKLKNYYEYVVIGGGINGIGIFRELTLHQKKVLLVEKKSFMSQTSSKSSKMLHGGIRYLESFDFSLVYEALKEKNLWLRLCPEMCQSKEFFIPVYKDSPHPLWKLSLGVKLYDALSLYQQPFSHFYSREKTESLFPFLKNHELKGSVSYYDAIFDDYKLGLKLLESSLQKSNLSTAYERTSIIKLQKEKNLYHLTLKREDQTFEVLTHSLIFATGPFTDQVMQNLKVPWTPKLVLSRGSHLFIKKSSFELKSPVVIQEGHRVIFLIPHKEYHLLGTTEKETLPQEELFDLDIEIWEKEYLLKNFKRYFNKEIKEEDILKVQTGIRPLVQDPNSSVPGKISRRHEIYSPLENCYVLLGGKWTTFRKMASDVVQMIFAKEGKSYHPNLSKTVL